MKKLLRVTGPTNKGTYCAVAILAQHGATWAVERTAPALAWMRGLEMAAIKQRLTDEGARWEWTEVSELFAQIAERHQPTRQRPKPAAKPAPAANVTEGEQKWFDAVQNAIKAEARKKAIVRNVRGKRKDKVTDDAR